MRGGGGSAEWRTDVYKHKYPNANGNESVCRKSYGKYNRHYTAVCVCVIGIVLHIDKHTRIQP